MKTMLWIFIFIMFQCMVSMESTETVSKLLAKTPDGKWYLEEATKRLFLNEHKDKFFHVVSIMGTTRAGKSYLMKSVVDQIVKTGGGTKHFGCFEDRAGENACTVGIDAVLVESVEGNLILLLDCEGAGSCEATNLDEHNKHLMVIMSLITQKLIHASKTIDNAIVKDVSAVLLARDSVCNENAPHSHEPKPETLEYALLNKLCFVFNQYSFGDRDFPIEDDYAAKEEQLKAFFNRDENKQAKTLLERFASHTKVMMVHNAKHDQAENFLENDIKYLVKYIIEDSNNTFCVNLGSYVDHLENILKQVNASKSIIIQDIAAMTYKNIINNKIKKMKEEHPMRLDMYLKYDNNLEHKIKERYINKLEADFEEYKKNESNKKIIEKFAKEVEVFILALREQNTKYGKLVSRIEYVDVRREEKPYFNNYPYGEIVRKRVDNTGYNLAMSSLAGVPGLVGGLIYNEVEKKSEIRKITEKYLQYQQKKRIYENGYESPFEDSFEDHTRTYHTEDGKIMKE